MRLILYAVLTLAVTTAQLALADSLLELERNLVAIVHTELQIKNIVGTGFIAAPSGLVVTADHVITDDAGKPYSNIWAWQPVYPKTSQYKLTLVKRFRDGLVGRDLALLKPERPIDAPGLSVGSFREPGESVVIGGFPLIFDRVYIWPLFRRGIIASTRYSYQEASILVLDLPTVQGFSGSPVINEKTNQVVGVVMAYPSKHSASDFSVATVINAADLANQHE